MGRLDALEFKLEKPVRERGEISTALTVVSNGVRIEFPPGYNGWKSWSQLKNLCHIALGISERHAEERWRKENGEED